MTLGELARRALTRRVNGQFTVMLSLIFGMVGLIALAITVFFALNITGSFAEGMSGASYEPTGLNAVDTVASGTALKLLAVGGFLGIPASIALFILIGGRVTQRQRAAQRRR